MTDQGGRLNLIVWKSATMAPHSPPTDDALFAVPFEEDDRNQKIWFLDHSYLEAMFAMFRKVNGEIQAPKIFPYPAAVCQSFCSSSQG